MSLPTVEYCLVKVRWPVMRIYRTFVPQGYLKVRDWKKEGLPPWDVSYCHGDDANLKRLIRSLVLGTNELGNSTSPMPMIRNNLCRMQREQPTAVSKLPRGVAQADDIPGTEIVEMFRFGWIGESCPNDIVYHLVYSYPETRPLFRYYPFNALANGPCATP
ncbi:hypothetical protein NPIL_249761 [Nephila pilipes]|uniref:Uncharacterized protein n=1 Tax=Nephila pilipes TaxID=299642 RepID=A0A8X6TXE0_NEPPI|nr:hypothetical protein NPIL_249761 [Nephila pilipes]